jgi:hypothetical protein
VGSGLQVGVYAGPKPGGSLKGEQGMQSRERMVSGMIATATPEIQQKVRKMMLTDASERTAVEASLAMFGPKETGAPFDFPALGLYAGQRSGTLAPQLPNSKIVGIERSGHFVMLEKADQFNRLLGDFLDSVKF